MNSDNTTPLPIVNRSQSNTTLYIDVSLIDLRKLLYVNLKSGEIFTGWFIFWGGSLVGVNFLLSLVHRLVLVRRTIVASEASIHTEINTVRK